MPTGTCRSGYSWPIQGTGLFDPCAEILCMLCRFYVSVKRDGRGGTEVSAKITGDGRRKKLA